MPTKKPQAPYLSEPAQDLNWAAGDAFLASLQQEPEPEKSGTLRRVVGDTGVSLLKSAVGVPEALVGMADLVTGGHVGKALENKDGDFGFRPKEANAYLDTLYSPEQQAANQKVQQADGFVDTLKAAVENPSTIYHGAVTSAGSYLAALPVVRGALAVAPKLGVIASGLGEAAATAGQNAEQVREESPDGLLTPRQAAILASSGAVTGAITAVAGRLANALGIGDPNQLFLGMKQASPAVQKGFARKLAEGFATEGLLQELPQSWQEQVAQNIAQGKPWNEGAGNAAVMGALSGGLMGGAAAPFGHGADIAPVHEKTPGDLVRDEKLPEVGPLTRGVNAAVEGIAKQADAQAAVAPPAAVEPPALMPAAEPAAPPVAEPTVEPTAEPVSTEPAPLGAKVDADTALARMERQAQRDTSAMRDFSSPKVEKAPAAETPAEPTVEAVGDDSAPSPEPHDVVNPKTNAPWRSKIQAQKALKAFDGPATIASVDGGFVIRPYTAKATAQAAIQAQNKADHVPSADVAAAAAPADAQLGGGQHDAPVAQVPREAAPSIAGEKINDEWTAFNKESGTKAVPRADMPQIQAEHRGALVNFLNARGIAHQSEVEIPSATLKPTQAEFSPAKVEKAKAFEGGGRSILVSSDGHVLDGHHQWLAKREAGEPVKAIVLDAPIDKLVDEVKQFPSAEAANGSTSDATGKAAPSAEADESAAETGRAATEPAQAGATQPKPSGKKRTTRDKAHAAREAKRAEYFTPGNIVNGYGGFDEVLAYHPAAEGKSWSVTVQRVRKVNGEWVREGKPQDARTHSTEPDSRELADGPVAKLESTPASAVRYTEPRADGKPFAAAHPRGAQAEVEAKADAPVKPTHERATTPPVATDKNVAGRHREPRQSGDNNTGAAAAKSRDSLILYHGSNESDLSAVGDRVGSTFGGIFASASRSTAESHGGHSYAIELDNRKVLTQYALEYEIEHDRVVAALREAMPRLADDDVDVAYKAAIEDQSHKVDDDELMRVFSEDTPGGASWEAQRIRGLVARKLGFQAVEMSDEHGTSYLVLPGAKLRPTHEHSASQNRDAAVGSMAGTAFSRAPSFDANVDAVLDGTKPESEAVAVSSAPAVLTALGMKPLPLATTGDRIAKMHFDHGLTRSEIKSLPDMIERPVMVFESETQPGSKVLVLDMWKNGLPVIAAVAPDKNLKRIQVNLLASAYPKNTTGPLGKWFRDGLLRYADKDKARAWATNGGVQFPWLVQLQRGLGSSVIGPADLDKAQGGTAGSGTKAAGASRVDDVKSLAERIASRWENAPPVIVVENMDDPRVPEGVRKDSDTQRANGADGESEGFFHGGKVYLVADQLHGDANVVKVLFHEALGHYGLRGVFGKYLNPILDRLAVVREAQVRAKAASYKLDYDIPEERRLAAEEVLAEMSQRHPEMGWVKRAIAAVRNWFRTHVSGFDNATLTDNDVRFMLVAAREFVAKGKRLVGADGVENLAHLTDGRAMHSRSIGAALTAGMNNAAEVKLPAGYLVRDFIESHGKLHWWHKSVGTMHNLAERNPLFKRVYDGVQTFLNDVSSYATEAADLAPTILPKLEHWKDIAKSPLSAEDTKAMAAPIFEGTLLWTRDEDGKPVKVKDLEAGAAALTVDDKAHQMLRAKVMDPNVLRMWQGLPIEQYETMINGKYEREMFKAGVVWSDAELKSMFNLSEKQVGLYKEFRAATDKSLTHLAVSDMLRLAGKDVTPEVRAAALEAGDVDRAAEILRDHLFDHAKQDPGRADVLNDTGNKMVEKADRARDLMNRGYAPLSRYGEHTVYVTEGGEQRYFGMFESQAEANRMARKMREEFPAAEVTQGTVSQEAYRLFAGVSPETLALFGEMLGLDEQGDDASSKAFQTYLKLATGNRSSMKRLIERKGIAGFSEDVGRVLAGFVYSNARQTSSNLHMGEVSDAVAAIPTGPGQLRDAAEQLRQYISTPQEEASRLRGLMFAQYLGGSVASAMVNMTQPLAVTFPYLSQYGGVRKAAAQMAAAVRDAGRKTTGDKALDAALKQAEQDGIVSPQEVHQLMAQARGQAALKAGDGTRVGNAAARASNAFSKFQLAWGKLFSMAEQVNRRITFIAAYRTAVAHGMDNPSEFAAKAIAETQFTYNRGNKPKWARGALGSTLFTFKQYSISYIELMSRMAKAGPEGRRAVLLALGVMFLLSGANGLPFEADIEDVIDGVLQHLGYNFSTKQAKREFFASVFGKAGGEFVERGISGLPGVPIDVAGRMGMGNLIPGTGLLTKKQDHTSDLAEFAGPVADLGKRGLQAAGQIGTGDLTGAGQTLSPQAVRNAVKAWDMATTGMYRDDKGRKVLDVDGYDALMKAIGFQPNDVAKVQQASAQVQQGIALNKMREGEIADQWAKALFERDLGKIAEAREAMQAWNKANPESPIHITAAQLRKRVESMRQSKAQRLAKTAPREIRASVRRELATEAP